MTNRAANNEVVSFARAADGTLTSVNRYPTRGNAIADGASGLAAY